MEEQLLEREEKKGVRTKEIRGKREILKGTVNQKRITAGIYV